jgi:hypothetical protein
MSKLTRLPLLGTTAIVAVVAIGSLAGSAEGAKCKSGVHKFGSVKARTFCGPASAKAVVGGKTFTFTRGYCVKTSKYVALNLGTIVLGSTSKPRPNYFGLDVGRVPGSSSPPASKDGTYSQAIIAIVHGHKGYSVGHSTVTLTNKRTRGTFTAKLTADGSTVTGSFRCK